MLRLVQHAELDQQPKRRAALVLGLERPADIAQRPILVRKDVREGPYEHEVQRGRLTGEGLRQDGDGRVSLDQLRQMDAPLLE